MKDKTKRRRVEKHQTPAPVCSRVSGRNRGDAAALEPNAFGTRTSRRVSPQPSPAPPPCATAPACRPAAAVAPPSPSRRTAGRSARRAACARRRPSTTTGLTPACTGEGGEGGGGESLSLTLNLPFAWPCLGSVLRRRLFLLSSQLVLQNTNPPKVIFRSALKFGVGLQAWRPGLSRRLRARGPR